MKVGNLVKRRDPSWDTQEQLGLVLELETFKQALNPKANNKVAKVKWLGGDYPSFMYRANDLILVSEA
tara:strand:- start:27 stop:230 length:204 start_codon:yes stop_codon:yes gene_type:complete